LRNTYLENNLTKVGKATVCGEAMDMRRVDTPLYIYGSREDHIVPIDAAYASTQVFLGPKRFVMGGSGHIAGVINPPEAKKRSYWTGKDSQFPKQFADWSGKAQEHAGSWWPDWIEWIAQLDAAKVAAEGKRVPGGRGDPVIEDAPGRYVKAR
jgi:polyhydroxyalkanoate synthase